MDQHDKGTPPVGRQFRHVYLEKGAPAMESARARQRLAHFILNALRVHQFDYERSLWSTFREEFGADEYNLASDPYNIGEFLKNAPIEDVLSAITVISDFIGSYDPPSPRPGDWHAFVERVIREENLAYRLDERCGVHPLVDVEFEHGRVSTIRNLGGARYDAVRTAFEEAHDHLGIKRSDTKAAIRSAFEAAEIMFKKVVEPAQVSTLSKQKIGDHLKPIVKEIYGGDEVALIAANLMLDSFGHWAAAAHQYRHGPATEVPVEPPLDLAVSILGAGAGHIRWLADLDIQRRENGDS